MQSTITKEEINLLPILTFTKNIVMVETVEGIKTMLTDLGQTDIIGFDTETKPSFKKGERHKISLIQFSGADNVYLVRIDKIGFHPLLVSLFENAKIEKVGASINDDLRGLYQYKRFKPSGCIDLQKVVLKHGIADISVQKMAAIILGVKISKKEQLSNWSAPDYTPAQMRYAAIDAWVCREMYLKLIMNGEL